MSEDGAKYQKVVDYLKEEIASGALKPGDRMPSEMELSKKFGVSRQTIRHATGELVSLHLVSRVRGSGTYVEGKQRPKREKNFRRVAVISTFYESYIFPQILKGIEHTLSAADYSMQVSFTDNRVAREEKILQGILEQDAVDGIIVEPSRSALPNPNFHLYRKLMDRNIPILFFNAVYPGLDLPCVRLDDEMTAKKAVDLLVLFGHRRIGGIFKADDNQGRLRYEGYSKGLRKAGLELLEEQVVWIDTPETLGLGEIGSYLLKRLKGCTGLVCYNDEVACQMIEIAESAGIRVPDDLSVTGMDDANIAAVSGVPLTTFPHPKEELGRKAAENLLRMIENPLFDGNYLFEAEPVMRASVTKAKPS